MEVSSHQNTKVTLILVRDRLLMGVKVKFKRVIYVPDTHRH